MNDVIEKLRAADEKTHPPYSFEIATATRRGQNRLRRRRLLHASTGAAAIGLVATVAIAWPEGGLGGSSVVSGRAEDHLSLLTEPQQPSDELPDELTDRSSAADELVESSSRAIGETDKHEFWAVVNTHGEICLAGRSSESGGHASVGCAEPADFAERGVTVPAGPDAVFEEARLLPDGYDVGEEPWLLLTPNLALEGGETAGEEQRWRDPHEYLSVLSEPPGPNDALPADVLAKAPPLRDEWDQSTTRFLGETADARFWVGVDHHGHLCLAMVHADREPGWAKGCGGFPYRTDSEILTMEAGGVRAQLLGDGYEPSSKQTKEWTFVTPNLAVKD